MLEQISSLKNTLKGKTSAAFVAVMSILLLVAGISALAGTPDGPVSFSTAVEGRILWLGFFGAAITAVYATCAVVRRDLFSCRLQRDEDRVMRGGDPVSPMRFPSDDKSAGSSKRNRHGGETAATFGE